MADARAKGSQAATEAMLLTSEEGLNSKSARKTMVTVNLDAMRNLPRQIIEGRSARS